MNDASKDLLIDAIIKHEAKTQQHMQALIAEWAAKSNPDKLNAIHEKLDANPTQYGSLIGKVLPVPTAPHLKKSSKRPKVKAALPKQ